MLLLDSPDTLRSVRIRSTTLVRLLHGFDLLPSGIAGKMTLPWISLLSLLASCLDAIAMSRYLPLVCQPPKMP